jgi:hypothetical protein
MLQERLQKLGVPRKLVELKLLHLLRSLANQRGSDVLAVTEVEIANNILLQELNDPLLLLQLLLPLEPLPTVGHKAQLVHHQNRVLDVPPHLPRVGGQQQVGLAVYDDGAEQQVELEDLADGGGFDGGVVLLWGERADVVGAAGDG